MNSWLRALSLSFMLALAACGGGGSSGPAKTAPTANFAFSCVDLACTFVNLSTSQDASDSIIAYTWTFGDSSPTVATPDAAHTYAAASTYTVSLLVIDSQGLRSTATKSITVTAPAGAAPAPHANFSVSCISFDCTFTDTSTYDVGSVPQSRLWDFGDTVTLATTNPATHTYPTLTTPKDYAARLTVTDAAGNSSTIVRTIVVAPPATTLGCASASCSLNLTQAARVTVTLMSHSCLARHNTVLVTSPVTQTVLSDGCFDATGVPVSIGGGALYPAGTALQLSVLSGTLPTSTIVFSPTIRLSGDFAQGWTLTFDDGYGGAAEPDFNDLVILVKATP